MIEYKPQSGKSWSKLATVPGSVRSRCLENLREEEPLLFRVAAENLVGVGPPTPCDLVRLERYASEYRLVYS